MRLHPKFRWRVLTLAFAAVSCTAWVYGYLSVSHGYYWRDLWFHIILFSTPVALVALSLWVAFHPKLWRKLLGCVLLVPSLLIWVLYLLLAAGGFRIH